MTYCTCVTHGVQFCPSHGRDLLRQSAQARSTQSQLRGQTMNEQANEVAARAQAAAMGVQDRMSVNDRMRQQSQIHREMTRFDLARAVAQAAGMFKSEEELLEFVREEYRQVLVKDVHDL